MVGVTRLQDVRAVSMRHVQLVLPLILTARACREIAIPVALAIPANKGGVHISRCAACSETDDASVFEELGIAAILLSSVNP